MHGGFRLVRLGDEVVDVRTHLGVEASGGLVVENEDGVHDEGAGDREALGHAAGEDFARTVHDLIGVEADVGEGAAGEGHDLGLTHAFDLGGPERKVVVDGAGQEGVALEDHGPMHTQAVHLVFVERGEIAQGTVGFGR